MEYPSCSGEITIMYMKKFCAHRGVSKLMPENTLPSFAAAMALGADEIELDIRLTKDNQLIISHDNTLERISEKDGELKNYTLQELKRINIGVRHGWNISFCTMEEVFDHFANKIILNLHIKEHGENGYLIKELLRLIEKYNAYKSVYFAGIPGELSWMERIAPEIPRVAIQSPRNTLDIFEVAQKYHCAGVQFWLDMFDSELIDKFHENRMFCNLFYADDIENYDKYFDMGIDTILTNRMDIAAIYKNV